MGENRLIRERYRLIELIGRGGMGEVWRAEDEALGRKVAVKCLKPMKTSTDPAHSRAMELRFRREARVAASLQHRGITVVHDFGEDDGVLYLVMELLDGRNLLQLLDDGQRIPLPVPDLLDIAEQVAAALAYTHAQGVVHRDLKPANIIRVPDGTVKICDFGIARLGHDIGFTSRLTGTGMAMGTPHYMSPEQIAGGEVDHRSDLYSFGCVLYELATGAPPFDMDDAWAVLVRHRDTAPDPPRERRPELSEPLERLILDLLGKEPDDRPQDAQVVGKRLAAIQASAERASELPHWARTLTGGPQAVGRRGPRPAAEGASLAGAWYNAAWAARPRHTADPELLAVLASRHNAALSLGRLGRWAEAVEVHRAVAQAREEALGAEHPETLASRYELGFALSRLGLAQEALNEYERVVAARSRALGADHPQTLAARQETAFALGRLGRHEEAHQVYTEVLAARARTMGAEHPDTLRCRHNLAFNLGRLGRLQESYETAREVAAARSRVLGAGHPDTLVTRFEVAYVLGQLGRWEDALAEYRDVVAARSASLGPDHPDTLAARYEVGICLGRLGRSEEALKLYRDLAAVRARVQGAEHPETLRARHGMGVNLGRLGRWKEALAEAHQVYEARSRVLGPEHPDTLVSGREVAVALGWLGRWDEALGLYRVVAEGRERALGPNHPDTLTSRNDEAHCLEQLGRGAEAVDVYRRVAAIRREYATTTQ
jgi:tetratricopeptide (TPR) repeat protein/tRNA A-37 threonylcarbamoyl transferase component Bud32